MRLFFAILLPDELLDAVDRTQREIRAAAGDEPGIRWTRRDQFHYTVKFLGEQAPPKMAKAVAAAGATREGIRPFEMALGGIGAFPSSHRPTTLWLGATEGADAFTAMAGELDKSLVSAGFSRESRPFTAHLTLARVKSYTGEKAVARVLQSHSAGEVGRFTVDRLTLMRSVLKPSGSEYAVVDEFAFTSN